MSPARILSALALMSSAAFAQTPATSSLAAPTTLPIVFTQSVAADHAKPGDAIQAKTIQQVELPGGAILPSGSRVMGHVVAASGFSYDKTPYARQQPSTLSVHFDTVQFKGGSLPLNVTVRAIASPIASWDAKKPQASDMDSLGTLTQIGGDQLVPSQSEVRNMDGDVVAYNKHRGV